MRYCGKKQIDGGKILPSAFALRPCKDDNGLSGDHQEHYAEGLSGVLLAMQKRNYTPSGSGCFAILECGVTIERVMNKTKVELSFVKPDIANSHTLLQGYGAGDKYDVVCLLLAKLSSKTKTITELGL